MSKKKLSKILVWIGLCFIAFAITFIAAGTYTVYASLDPSVDIEMVRGLFTAAIVFGSFAIVSICGGVICKILCCKECGNKTSAPVQQI